VPYAGFVEFGTKPHEIRPKSAKVLRFSVGGKTVYTKRVRHPGTKAQPFMKPAVDRVVGNFAEETADIGVKLIVEGAGRGA
jgi:hypothetical protein